jgi:hypothetical protein
MAAGERGIFGRAIAIDQPTIRKIFESTSYMARRKHIATGQKLANGLEILQSLLDHEIEQARRKPECRDVLLSNDPSKIF